MIKQQQMQYIPICWSCLCMLFLSFIFHINVSSANPSVATGGEAITVGYHENKPMCYTLSSGKPAGIFVAVLDYAAAKEGWQVEYIKGKWSELRKKLERGEIDMLLSMAVSKERAGLYKFNTVDVFNNWAEVYVQVDSKIYSLLDLKDKRVATLSQGIYTTGPEGIYKLSERFQLNCQFVEVDEFRLAMEAVKSKLADAAVVNRLVGAVHEKEYGLRKSGIVFAPVRVRFAMSHQNPRTPGLVKGLDHHIANLKQDSGSVYYQEINRALGGGYLEEDALVPGWVFYLVVIAGIIIFAITSILLLFRWQLHSRTSELRASESRFRTLVENLPGVVYRCELNAPWRVDHISEGALSLTGHPAADFIDKKIAFGDLILPDDVAMVEQHVDEGIANNHPYEIEYRMQHANGSIVWVFEKGCALYGQDRTPIWLDGVIIDITERKKIEAEKQKSDKRFRDLAKNSSDWIWEFDEQTIFTYSSPRVLDLLGYRPDEVIGKSAFDFIPSPEKEKVAEQFNQSKDAHLPFANLQNVNQHKDGRLVAIESSGMPIFDEHGTFRGYRGIDRDITGRKKLEQELKQAHKMEAIGTLAGGIAHDFNNILAAIIGYTELAMLAVPDHQTVQQELNEVISAALRAKELVKRILQFSRKEEQQFETVEAGHVFKEALKLVRATLPSSVIIEASIDEECGPILADPTQLHQVLMNLASNAFHAMENEQGVFSVSLSRREIQPHEKIGEIYPATGMYIELIVKDDGQGMDKETLARIFDPYFTTKEIGKGTGLGMSLVHGIVKSHGGMVQVDSAPGMGTTFHIYFPSAAGKEQLRSQETEDVAVLGQGHVLFVDDEKTLVQLGERMLQNFGYTVTATTSSAEALDLFSREPQDFDMVITDQTMPGMTGIELIQEIFKLRKDIPVLLCSGYSSMIDGEKAAGLGIKAMIHKPLQWKKLAGKMKELLVVEE